MLKIVKDSENNYWICRDGNWQLYGEGRWGMLVGTPMINPGAFPDEGDEVIYEDQ